MSQPAFIRLGFDGGWDAVLAAVPASPGVGQFLAEANRSLLVGRASNLRRWVASHLGAAQPLRKGARPGTDLRPVARALRFARSSSAFHQLWLFERLMAQLPLSNRRDLKPPAYLHLDPEERFPRLTVRAAAGAGARLFGPFRDGRGASRAAEAVAKRFRLRPCDASFEPDPTLPLGLRCVYAQVGSCAAPCLARVSEAEYRALAVRAAALLSHPDRRQDELAELIPPWVAAASGRGLAVESVGSRLELYPIRGGAVLDGEIQSLVIDELGGCLQQMTWALPQAATDDRPWLLPWLLSRKRRGVFLALGEAELPQALAARLRGVLSAPEPGDRGGRVVV